MDNSDNNCSRGRGGRIAGGSAKAGIGFGSCLAMVISYVTWNSIGWAILHGLLGWIYVVYFVIKYGF